MSGLEEALALTLSLMSDLVQEKDEEKSAENVKDRMNGLACLLPFFTYLTSDAGKKLLGRNRYQIQSVQEVSAKEKFQH